MSAKYIIKNNFYNSHIVLVDRYINSYANALRHIAKLTCLNKHSSKCKKSLSRNSSTKCEILPQILFKLQYRPECMGVLLGWHILPKTFQTQPAMTETTEEYRPFAAQLSNVYLTILALFCFKLFVRITLNLLTHFYIIKGNRREAARISADFYGNGQGYGSWADRSPLHDAASQGRLLALKTLIAQGHSVNVLTIDHISPLHEACIGSHVACARALIDAGANVNVTTIDGVTPLFNACSAGSLPCLEFLLQSDARPQALAICQPSPIHETVSRGHSKCVEALVEWGVDVDYEIPHMGTPLYSACRCREFLCARKLLDGGANVQTGTNMETPLHAAAQKDCVSIVKLLLEYGADINARNLEYKRPVEVAPPGSFTEGFLLIYEATPRSLRQLCRQQIRESLGRSRLHFIPDLPLPKAMKDFLQYK